jgi:hypothetical protein
MKRPTVRNLMIATALLAPFLAWFAAPLARIIEFQRVQRRMDAVIRNLRPSPLRNVNPTVWDCAHSITITAYVNICFGPGHVSTAEMYRLRDDLDRKFRDEIDLDTLVWIWERLAETGPHGRDYVARHNPLLLQCFPAPVPTIRLPPPPR